MKCTECNKNIKKFEVKYNIYPKTDRLHKNLNKCGKCYWLGIDTKLKSDTLKG